MIKTQLIEIEQPVGIFYLGALPADIIIKTTIVKQRSQGGVQRDPSQKRIDEIAKFSNDPDATFPTPIIIAINKSDHYSFENNILQFDENCIIGEIIDGQHRIKGIEKSGNAREFELPVIIMFDMTEEEKAYIFSIINSKQTKVSMSLIYDLFDLSAKRSPQKTCHELARLLNSDSRSPFYKRMKMLGKKTDELSSLSQGSFIKYLLPLISKDPTEDSQRIKKNMRLIEDEMIPFRQYFIDNEDERIYKILSNVFNAVKFVFPNEWESPNKYILSKTTGYGAIIYAFNKKLYHEGVLRKDLTLNYFIECFNMFKEELIKNRLQLTSEFYPSNEQQMKKLGDLIIRSVNDNM